MCSYFYCSCCVFVFVLFCLHRFITKLQVGLSSQVIYLIYTRDCSSSPLILKHQVQCNLNQEWNENFLIGKLKWDLTMRDLGEFSEIASSRKIPEKSVVTTPSFMLDFLQLGRCAEKLLPETSSTGKWTLLVQTIFNFSASNSKSGWFDQ